MQASSTLEYIDSAFAPREGKHQQKKLTDCDKKQQHPELGVDS
jgi:hypothetical protein